MKKNKLKVGIVTSLLMLSMAMTTAFASKQGNFYYSNANAYVRGYVDLQSALSSKVWCNVGLNGADRDVVSASYTLKTDKKVIDKYTLSPTTKQNKRYIEVGGGVWAQYAQLTIKYEGKSATLKQSK